MGDEPLSRELVMTAKAIRELFEDALAKEGTSLATWVVLNGVERGRWASQSGLAKKLRIEGATVTRHLDRLEREASSPARGMPKIAGRSRSSSRAPASCSIVGSGPLRDAWTSACARASPKRIGPTFSASSSGSARTWEVMRGHRH